MYEGTNAPTNMTAAGARRYAEDAQPTKRPQVDEQFASLVEAIAHIDDASARMEKALVNSGVLRVDPEPSESPNNATRASLVPAAERLRDQSERASQIARFIESLIRRLEI